MTRLSDEIGLIRPPERVEILRARPEYHWKWKPGQFAYATSFTLKPQATVDQGPSAAGQLVFGVAKRKDLTTGVYYFTAGALRFTRRPRSLAMDLSDDEKVAVDLLLSNHDDKTFAALVPDKMRRLYIKMIADRLERL